MWNYFMCLETVINSYLGLSFSRPQKSVHFSNLLNIFYFTSGLQSSTWVWNYQVTRNKWNHYIGWGKHFSSAYQPKVLTTRFMAETSWELSSPTNLDWQKNFPTQFYGLVKKDGVRSLKCRYRVWQFCHY